MPSILPQIKQYKTEEATDALIGNKIPEKIRKVSIKNYPQSFKKIYGYSNTASNKYT